MNKWSLFAILRIRTLHLNVLVALDQRHMQSSFHVGNATSSKVLPAICNIHNMLQNVQSAEYSAAFSQQPCCAIWLWIQLQRFRYFHVKNDVRWINLKPAIGHSENRVLTSHEMMFDLQLSPPLFFLNDFVGQIWEKASFTTFRQRYCAVCRSSLQNFMEKIMASITTSWLLSLLWNWCKNCISDWPVKAFGKAILIHFSIEFVLPVYQRISSRILVNKKANCVLLKFIFLVTVLFSSQVGWKYVQLPAFFVSCFCFMQTISQKLPPFVSTMLLSLNQIQALSHACKRVTFVLSRH